MSYVIYGIKNTKRGERARPIAIFDSVRDMNRRLNTTKVKERYETQASLGKFNNYRLQIVSTPTKFKRSKLYR